MSVTQFKINGIYKEIANHADSDSSLSSLACVVDVTIFCSLYIIKPFSARKIIQNWNDGILKMIIPHGVLHRASLFLGLHSLNNLENHWLRTLAVNWG